MRRLINKHGNSAVVAAEPGGILRLECPGTFPGPIKSRQIRRNRARRTPSAAGLGLFEVKDGEGWTPQTPPLPSQWRTLRHMIGDGTNSLRAMCASWQVAICTAVLITLGCVVYDCLNGWQSARHSHLAIRELSGHGIS